jgi:hypothetical protein
VLADGAASAVRAASRAREAEASDGASLAAAGALVLVFVALVGCGGAPPPRSADRPSLLLLSADSLRADRLALFEPATGVRTPRLERLARTGVRFSATWAVTPWTAPSMVSVFTGLYPPRHGVAYRDDTTPLGLPTLPRILADAGYRVGNFSFFSAISYFRNLGFPAPPAGLGHDREAEIFARWLETTRDGEPFFAWIHLLHPHLPYGASGYRARSVAVPGSSGLEASQLKATLPVGSAEFATGDRERLLELYDADVSELDRAVGAILDALAERALLERTVVVFVADHGEELLEHGWVGHASTAQEAKLVPEVLRIPLLLVGPGVVRGEVSHRLAQHVDVMPTVLGLLGVEAPGGMDGRDLLARPSPVRRLLASVGLAEGDRSFVYFDSSPGGNLTPPERRHERLQGVADGVCLLTSHTAGGGEETAVVPLADDATCDREALADALRRWREEQGAGRLELLARHGDDGAVDLDRLQMFDDGLEIRTPASGAGLEWGDGGGQLELEWTGKGPRFWVQYDIGRGAASVRGTFEVEQTRLVFGPFPRGFWNDLAGYSPFRFRVADPAARRRSAWHSFTVVETR